MKEWINRHQAIAIAILAVITCSWAAIGVWVGRRDDERINLAFACTVWVVVPAWLSLLYLLRYEHARRVARSIEEARALEARTKTVAHGATPGELSVAPVSSESGALSPVEAEDPSRK